MADINAIAEQIQGLTLLEASQLVKTLEEKLGVSAAAAAVAMAPAAGGAAAAAPAEEKTEFTVVLASAGANKMGLRTRTCSGASQVQCGKKSAAANVHNSASSCPRSEAGATTVTLAPD